jgi:hypothetical protein
MAFLGLATVKRGFDVIIGNLKKVKKEYPRFFNENIAFSVVLVPPYDFELLTPA